MSTVATWGLMAGGLEISGNGFFPSSVHERSGPKALTLRQDSDGFLMADTSGPDYWRATSARYAAKWGRAFMGKSGSSFLPVADYPPGARWCFFATTCPRATAAAINQIDFP